MLLAVAIGPLAVARLAVELTTTGERAKLYRLLVLSFLALKQLFDVLFRATSNNLLVPVGGFFHFYWSRQPPAFGLKTAEAHQKTPVLRSDEDITASISGPTVAWAVTRKGPHGLPCGSLGHNLHHYRHKTVAQQAGAQAALPDQDRCCREISR
ncbi:hypothetical protein MRX96_034221 [Rhipicephalus microplus]